jgi:hypothetical protein
MKVTTNIQLTTNDVKTAIAEFLADRGYDHPRLGEIGFVSSPNTMMAQVTIEDDHQEEGVKEEDSSDHLVFTSEDLDAMDVSDTINGRDVRAYFSPELNNSFGETIYTVLGYLAEYHPEIIEASGDAASQTQRDGFWLTRRYPVNPAKVKAPLVLREQGIDTVNAYPKWLLAQRFGTDLAAARVAE